MEFGAVHCAKALAEILGDRDESLVWALLPRRRLVTRQVSELGESLEEGFMSGSGSPGGKSRAPLATQDKFPPMPGLPGSIVLSQCLKR